MRNEELTAAAAAAAAAVATANAAADVPTPPNVLVPPGERQHARPSPPLTWLRPSHSVEKMCTASPALSTDL